MAYFGFHAFQSFVEGEVTPEIAHEIGVKLAEELWGDRFEVVVSTHINTKHVHNHFCLNSVSFKDGKKYYNNRHTLALLRRTSDELCREYNLSVLKEKPCGKHNIDYTKYYGEQVQKSSYYNDIKEDIDYAIEQAYSFQDFLSLMKKMDYVVENRAGKLSVRKLNRKRNTRIERVFGDEYKIERINERIYETESVRLPFPEVRTLKGKYKYSSKNKKRLKNKRKIKGIRALYFHYCYLLKFFPKKKRRMSKYMREEIKKLDKYSSEVRFLAKTGIQTDQELLKYKSSTIIKRKELKSKRENLWKKQKRAKTENEKLQMKDEIQKITNEIKRLNKEIEYMEDIETRIPEMKDNLKKMEEKDLAKNTEVSKGER